ncbi:putative bifunctional methylthioribulose-1-phosphate dehydratase/enolase-phosphatase E1 [Forsythia ovata]|uniref:Bifunctional methylthioribulose-1-phosphate dehydratase/enolase-phosphatase E1 n=1 Tax=Forsythia ovata TaxID=205694 RepID=A0ABD1RJ42_9LAMI
MAYIVLIIFVVGDYSDFSWRLIPWFQSCAAGSTTCFGCHIKTHDDSIPKFQQFIVMSSSGMQKERVVDENMYVLSTNGSVLFEPLAKPWPHIRPRCFVLEAEVTISLRRLTLEKARKEDGETVCGPATQPTPSNDVHYKNAWNAFDVGDVNR